MISIEGRGASSEKMQGEMGDGKIQLTNEKLIGNGSFGVVFQVALLSPFTLSGAHVALLRNFSLSVVSLCEALGFRPFEQAYFLVTSVQL